MATKRKKASRQTIDVTPKRGMRARGVRATGNNPDPTNIVKRGSRNVTPKDPWRNQIPLPLPTFVAGLHLSAREMMQLSVVWACMDAVVKAVVCCEWKIYERDGANLVERPDDEMYYLLNTRPNPEMTAISFREALGYAAVGTGNGYAEIVRSLAGKVVELWPLEADRVTPMRLYYDDGSAGPIVYRVLQYVNNGATYGGSYTYLPADKIYHVRGPSLDGFLGDNMLARAAHAIGNGVAQERFVGSYYQNNTIMGTILEHPRTLSEPAHQRLKRDWQDKHRGPNNAHKPFILEGGMKLTEVGHKPAEMQNIESRQFSVEEICRFFGVPPHKVQHLLRATFNNIEHLGIEFTRDAVTPWTERFEQEADYKLFPQKKPWRVTKHDTQWLMYGDQKSRAEAQAIYRRVGVYTANDILKQEGHNTVGAEGDVRLVESNMTTIDGVKATVEKTKADTKKALEPTPAPGAPGMPKPEEDEPAKPGEEKPKPKPKPGEEKMPPKKMPKKESDAVLRDAVSALFVGAFERYQRKQQNRESDLRRGGMNDLDIAAHLADARGDMRERLIEECAEAFAIVDRIAPMDRARAEHDVVSVAELTDNGLDPRDAANQLCDGWLNRSEA